MLPEEHLKEICKLGQGSLACRFLIFDCQTLQCECAKGTSLENTVNERKEKMRCRGNNCSGPPYFIAGNLDSQKIN